MHMHLVLFFFCGVYASCAVAVVRTRGAWMDGCLPAERGGLALAEHEHGRLQLLHLAQDGGQHGPLDHKRLHLHLTTFTQTKYYNTQHGAL